MYDPGLYDMETSQIHICDINARAYNNYTDKPYDDEINYLQSLDDTAFALVSIQHNNAEPKQARAST